jgi:hypothetical protein
MKKVKISIDNKSYEFEVEEKDLKTLLRVIDAFSQK